MKDWLKAISVNPLAWLLALFFLGASHIVAGVAIWFGVGPAFIVCGVFFLFFAGLLMRGMKPNG